MNKEKLRKFIDNYHLTDPKGKELLEQLYNGVDIRDIAPQMYQGDLYYLADAFPEVVKYYHWGVLSEGLWCSLFESHPEIVDVVNWNSMCAEDILNFVKLMPQYYNKCPINRLNWVEAMTLPDNRNKGVKNG